MIETQTESAVVFGRTGPLVGVVTSPGTTTSRAAAFPGVILLNAGLLDRTGPNRLNVKIARRLGQHGVTSLRFDLSGIGDSPARQDGLAVKKGEIVETTEAMDYLRDKYDLKKFVLLGLCNGADIAFRVAMDDSRVVGLITINGYSYPTLGSYVRRVGANLLRKHSWANVLTGRHPMWNFIRRLRGRKEEGDLGLRLYIRPSKRAFATGMERLIRRGLRLLAFYSKNRNHNYRGQFRDNLPSRSRERAIDEFFEAGDHTITLRCYQEHLVERVEAWMLESEWASAATTAERAGRTQVERADSGD